MNTFVHVIYEIKFQQTPPALIGNFSFNRYAFKTNHFEFVSVILSKISNAFM